MGMEPTHGFAKFVLKNVSIHTFKDEKMWKFTLLRTKVASLENNYYLCLRKPAIWKEMQ